MRSRGGMVFARRRNVPRVLVVLSSNEVGLHSINAVNAIDEQDQDEDKGDLHPVLDLGDNWVLGDEAVSQRTQSATSNVAWHERNLEHEGDVRKQLALEGEGQRHDEQHEQKHL